MCQLNMSPILVEKKNTALQQILHSNEFAFFSVDPVHLDNEHKKKNYTNRDFVHWANKKTKLYKLIELTWLGSIFFSAFEQGSFSSCSGIFTVEKKPSSVKYLKSQLGLIKRKKKLEVENSKEIESLLYLLG